MKSWPRVSKLCVRSIHFNEHCGDIYVAGYLRLLHSVSTLTPTGMFPAYPAVHSESTTSHISPRKGPSYRLEFEPRELAGYEKCRGLGLE